MESSNIGLVNIILIPEHLKTSKLITNEQIVPSGKFWIIEGFLNQTSMATSSVINWSINLNSNELYVGSLEAGTPSSSSRESRDSKFLYSGQLILPPGTTIEPNQNIYGLSVIEIN
jgi:hypothetical protein